MSILLFIVWVASFLEIIYILSRYNLSGFDVISLSLFTVPSFFFGIVPFSGFVTSMIVCGQIKNEILILKTSGVKQIALLKPFLAFFGLLFIVQSALSFSLLPLSLKALIMKENELGKNFLYSLLKENEISTIGSGIAYVREFDNKTKEFKDLVIDLNNEKRKMDTFIKAKEGSFSLPNMYLKANLFDVFFQQRTPDLFVTAHFDNYNIYQNIGNIFEDMKQFNPYLEPQLVRLDKLYKITLQKARKINNPLIKESYKSFLRNFINRLIWPLFSFLLPIISVALVFYTRFNRKTSTSLAPISVLFIGFSLFVFSQPRLLASLCLNINLAIFVTLGIFVLIFCFLVYIICKNR